MVKAVCHDLEYRIRKSNAQIDIGELPKIYAFETELRLLFQNLISNAIKFMAPGKTSIIKISADDKKTHWQFAVQDNGIGIDPQYKEKIFIIFQRLQGREEYHGTGIGLAHCQIIVELHHGEIWIYSELGKGSTFYFTINSNLIKDKKI